MNVYIASFMLLLFNAVGVQMPAAAVAAETAENQDVSIIQSAASLDWDGAERALLNNGAPAITRVASAYIAKPVWPVTPIIESTGDKLEHVEGAP